MAIFGTIIGLVKDTLFPVIDKAVVDKDKARELKHQFEMALLEMDQRELESATKIIVAEAGGESWLQRNWRPMTMLSFLGLLFSYWLGVAPDQIYANDDLMNRVFDLLSIGIGGYVGSRGIEKVVKTWKEPEKIKELQK